MGFCESEARKALAECVWDVNRALDLLVSRGVLASAPLPKSEVRGTENDKKRHLKRQKRANIGTKLKAFTDFSKCSKLVPLS